MKLAVQTQLLPDAAAAIRLRETIERFNEACNWTAGVAFEHQCSRAFDLHKIAYRNIRDRFNLLADMAVRVLAQVCDAFKRDKTIRPKFRKHAAVPYSMGRNVSFKGIDRVSISTLNGRVVVPFLMGKYQADRFSLKKGQSELVLRKDGKWFLIVSVDVPDKTPIPTTGFLGVDLGLAQIATDSDGNAYSGKPVEVVRRKHNLQRKRLQKRNTKGAKKKLERVSGKEARFRHHSNHVISKSIVQTAERTGQAIALEDLTGIGQRVTSWGKDARNRLSGWGFAQLGAFIQYKAQLAGIFVAYVDPRNTSRMCAKCGHVDKANRKSQAKFLCLSCGHTANADRNAAENISAQAARKSALELASLRA